MRRLPGADQAEPGRESALRLLSDQARDLPLRQQTLLKAISWSYDLLSADEQALLRRLSVFVDGCSVEAADAVGVFDLTDGLDVVASLIDKSLVWREEQPDGEPRLRLLETIREFAREQLETCEEAEVLRARHAAYYVDLVEEGARTSWARSSRRGSLGWTASVPISSRSNAGPRRTATAGFSAARGGTVAVLARCARMLRTRASGSRRSCHCWRRPH